MIIWRVRYLATRDQGIGSQEDRGHDVSLAEFPQVDELSLPRPSGIIHLRHQIRSRRGRCAHRVRRRHISVLSFRVKPEASHEARRLRFGWPLLCVAFLLLGVAIGLHRTPQGEPVRTAGRPHPPPSLPANFVAAQSLGELVAAPVFIPDAPSASSVRMAGDGTTPGYSRPPVRLTTYEVQPGDTLSAIAASFNTSTASLAQLNGLSSPDRISVGMELSVMENASGIVVKVTEGDTLWDISRRYGVSIAEIEKANNLDSSQVLNVGMTLILPGASARSVPVVSRSSSFRWPIQGSLTSGYGWRTHPITGKQSFHDGLDIAASTGTSIGAAAGGTVKHAGWLGGYGRLVIIDHGDGLETRYAHMSSIGVSTGQSVSAGETIGYVGQTGDATGPHVHFEIRKNGRTLNPRDYLP